ncbi:MAG: 4-(cytidine 5'-diphospho)-2-C-methyl-D-erythritol kinase [Rhodospirillales bacterium]
MSVAPGGGAVTVRAPAKVNLFLEIVGRRADGYHLLQSLVAFADVADVVRVRPSDDLGLAIDGPFGAGLAAEPDNLVLRAARGLAEATGCTRGATIALTKNIPVAAGLGGGSADAAAALTALAALWGVRLPDAARDRIALALGADVPVCLFGRPALVGGIGEAIAPAPALPPLGAVLVNPRIPVPTAAVFKARSGPFSPLQDFAPPAGDGAGFAAALDRRRNDLAAPAVAVAPVIAGVLDTIAATRGCLLARLSGSGATCFGLYGDTRAAESAAAAIAAAQPGWWVRATRFLDRPAAVERD